MKISVFGIGYVGAVTSACLCESGHHVMAMDVDTRKVEAMQKGESPIVEPQLSGLIQKHRDANTLSATQDVSAAVLNSDISLICVGTPSREDGSLMLDYVIEVCEQIGAAIKDKDAFHTVVLRSTCVPGTARDVAIPALEKASGKKAGIDFGFGNNPEFLRESTAVYDYFNPPKIVIGADDEKTARMISALYDGIDAPEVITDIVTAEGVKYADNAWHAMKVGFANELGNILSELGLDSHKVMEIFFKDTKLNISPAYLLPGFAFGGSCLPKDVRAIRASGQDKGVKTPIFDALLEANEEQVRRAETMIRASGKKKIALMGLAFKAGTDDVRESPLVKLADTLINDGFELQIYDPAINQSKSFNMPHFSPCLVKDPQDMSGAELFVIGNNTEEFGEILKSVNDNVPILDLVRLKNAPSERINYRGICW